jgi:hypothetical protein
MSNYTEKEILEKYIEYLKENPIQYCVSGLDYSSLYPSLIMAYNLSPEYLITNKEYKDELEQKGYNIHNINFEYNYKDYLGNDKTKDIIAWTVRHNESNKENSMFGLYPSILRDLFKQRAEMKKELAIYKDKKEHIEKYETDYLNNKEYKECVFKLKYCDTKQKALKVFMNTFYGVMGNKTSALFQLPLAGGVTSAGQYNLLLVKKYVESLNHKVYYGDTDSLYISCPKEYYLELDKQYYTNQITKEEYNTQLVLKTFQAIEDIKIKVNEYLYNDNGTKYLKMSYEEVLYPLAFLSKKKYFGIPHETLPNFKPKDLFIRGLEVKKRGVSELLRIICMDLMWKSMDLNNTKSLRELVEDKIKEIFNTKWNLEDFIQTGVWKPDKQNQTMNKFVERMKEENKQLPVERERFSYVIVKKYPYKYDYKGRQIALQKSDKMEYLDIVKKYNYDIDLKYYFDNQLTGQFARLITYDPEFEIIINNDIDEDKTYNQCQKYVLKLADQYNNNYKDRNKIFKKVYKEINNKYKEITTTKKIYDKKYNFLLNTNYKIKEIDNNNIYEILNYNIEEYIKTINHEIENISKNLLNKYKNNKVIIQKLYNTDSKSYYIVQISNLTNKLNNLIQKILNLITQYNLSEYIFNIDNMNIINLVNHIRKKYNLDDICNSTEEINDIYELIKEDELNIDLDDLNLYIKIDKNILEEIFNIYILILSIKKNILIHNYIYNKYYANINSNKNYIEKPYNFKL